MEGIEPPRLTAPDPKSGSATSYDTSAFNSKKILFYKSKKNGKDNKLVLAIFYFCITKIN